MIWLPKNKKAAICFSIDDIHPSKSSDSYEAGGDLSNGNLGLVEWLINRHPKLKTTLFTTADWRETTPFITKKILSKTPYFNSKYYLAKVLKKGTMSLTNHPEFVKYLNTLKRTDIALHGLHHIHKGKNIPQEFQSQTEDEFDLLLKEMLSIFNKSKINYVKGICPPSWNAPDDLLNQLINNNIKFVASARDIFTPISKEAKTNMSGLKNLPLIYPSLIKENKIVHIPTNFQATSKIDRAFKIIDNGGLLCIKAHIIKNTFGHIAYDGIDQLYINYLDSLFTILEKKYGDDLWWPSMNEIADLILKNN